VPGLPGGTVNGYRAGLLIIALVVGSLAVLSTVMLVRVSHDQGLHRLYACEFASDFAYEAHVQEHGAVCRG